MSVILDKRTTVGFGTPGFDKTYRYGIILASFHQSIFTFFVQHPQEQRQWLDILKNAPLFKEKTIHTMDQRTTEETKDAAKTNASATTTTTTTTTSLSSSAVGGVYGSYRDSNTGPTTTNLSSIPVHPVTVVMDEDHRHMNSPLVRSHDYHLLSFFVSLSLSLYIDIGIDR
jgi:hypothetical protein